ncbi:hypothetical protein BKA60DRAFT_588880 [Fusarium oxysporum]|nr:hypothetical protein BKA60DRAFT_588880 [Fusarium oxysporum]
MCQLGSQVHVNTKFQKSKNRRHRAFSGADRGLSHKTYKTILFALKSILSWDLTHSCEQSSPDTMSIQDLAQTHCNTMQHATQQLEHPRLDTTSPQEERTARPGVRRARRGARGRGPGKRLSMRDAFVDGSTLLREAARLARFDGMSLDLCFWDPGCSSWVGVEPRPSGVISRSIREFEDGRARFQKSLRSLHNRLAKYVEAYGVPCRFKCFDPFKEQWLVTIGAPAGWLMDSQDWKRAVSIDLK